MPIPAEHLCYICKTTFGSRYLAYLHVCWRKVALHTSLTALPVEPTEESRIRIYQSTLNLMVKSAYELSKRGMDFQLQKESYEVLMLWNRDAGNYGSVLRLIARGYDATKSVPGLCSRLGINIDAVRKALDQDTYHIVQVLSIIIVDSRGEPAVAHLVKNPTYAQQFGNLLGDIENDPRYWPAMCGTNAGEVPSHEQVQQGHRVKEILVKLKMRVSQDSLQLPDSIYITGVIVKDARPMGGGPYTDIYCGEYNDQRVAVKKLRFSATESPDVRLKQLRCFCEEALTWKPLNHAHVLPFLGISREILDNSFCMVSPWMINGNLIEYIGRVGFVEVEALRLISEIALGLVYLHEHELKMVHGDLRGSNVLIDEDGHARISDIGLSAIADPCGLTASLRNASTTWTPPELIDPKAFNLPNSRPRTESDIFAFSGLCWEVFNGHQPFHDTRAPEAAVRILEGERPYRRSTRAPIPNDLWNLMVQCWSHDYKLRPKASEVAAICESCKKTALAQSAVVKGKRRMQPKSTSALQKMNSSTSSSDDRSQDSNGSSQTTWLSPSGSEASLPPVSHTRPPTPSILRSSKSSTSSQHKTQKPKQSAPTQRPEPWSSIPYQGPAQKTAAHVTFGGVETFIRTPTSSEYSSDATSDTAIGSTETAETDSDATDSLQDMYQQFSGMDLNIPVGSPPIPPTSLSGRTTPTPDTYLAYMPPPSLTGAGPVYPMQPVQVVVPQYHICVPTAPAHVCGYLCSYHPYLCPLRRAMQTQSSTSYPYGPLPPWY